MRNKFLSSRAVAVALFASVTASGSFVLAPRLALAQNAPNSLLTGAKMPRNPVTFNAIASPFTGVLTALSKEKPVNLAPLGGKAEVWEWRGDSFRADRVSFTKTAVASALGAAGYTVSEINADELREVNVFTHFPIEDENLPFRPTILARPSFFKATNAAKKQTVLGAWIEDDDALALGILPVEFKAAAVAKPLPAVGGGAILVKNFKNVSASLPAPKMPTFAPLQKKPRVVRGWAKDMSGKPLANVEVAVHVSAGGGFRTTHKGRSNAQGLYEVLLPVGVAEVVEGKTRIPFNGQSLERFLAPASGNFKQFNAQNGHIENLILKSSGEFGGNIRLLHFISEGGTIEVTLSPTGAQADGTQGRTFVFRYPSGISSGETFFQFIPLSKYNLSANLLEDGETLPLRVRHTFGDDQTPQANLPVKWESGADYLSGDTGKSNLRAFQVTLVP